MTEKKFMALVLSIRAVKERPTLDHSLDSGLFDSLDLLELRSSLEACLNRELSSEKFRASSSLRDLYELVK